MNRYGTQAMRHWQQFLPQRYARLPNPNSFFSTLGDQAASQIADRTRELAGPDQPDEGYLAKLGRMNEAKLRAEEEILPQLILIDPTTDEPAGTNQPAGWVPLVEDPAHPWWRQVAEEEDGQLNDQADEDDPPTNSR